MQRNLSKSEHLPSRSWVDWGIVEIWFCPKTAAGHGPSLSRFFLHWVYGVSGLIICFQLSGSCPGLSRDEGSQHQSSSLGKIREKHTHRLMASVDSNGPHSVLRRCDQTSLVYQYQAFSDLQRVEDVSQGHLFWSAGEPSLLVHGTARVKTRCFWRFASTPPTLSHLLKTELGKPTKLISGCRPPLSSSFTKKSIQYSLRR